MTQLILGRLIVACALALGLISVSTIPALALESVKVRLINTSNEDLKKSLQAASLSNSLLSQDTVTVHETVAAAQTDYTRIVEALYAQGYYSAVVRITLDGQEAADVDPFNLPSRVNKLRILVEPGKRFKFGTADIRPLAPGSSQPEEFATGEPALATQVRTAVQAAVDGWREAGYAKATVVDQSITANHSDARLNVSVQVSPGPKLTFGDVVVSGTSTVRPGRVRQIAGLPRGEQFDPNAVSKGAERLRKTGTFQSVQLVEAETPNPDGSLDFGVTVIDRKPRRIGGGAEVSTLDGVTLTGYWLHRNIFGGAGRFSIDGKITQLAAPDLSPDYTLTFRFEKPAVYGPETLFFAELALAHEDEPDYLETKSELTFGASREFSEHLTGELGVSASDHRVTDYLEGSDETRELFVYSLPAKLAYDRRDDILDTHSGYYLSASLTPFHVTRESENGTLFEFDGRFFGSLGAEEQTVLAGRLQLGSLTGPSAVDAPPGYLFYSGGGGTVRGQPYESLGADHDGRSLGGRALAVMSTEVRYSVTDTIGVVGFADAGFVGADSFEDGNWHAGAGLGVRYKTPVGPIRVDAAVPVSGDTGNGLQLYIGIGQAF